MTPKKLRDEKRRAARMRNTPRHTQKVEALQKDLEEEPLIEDVEELHRAKKMLEAVEPLIEAIFSRRRAKADEEFKLEAAQDEQRFQVHA